MLFVSGALNRLQLCNGKNCIKDFASKGLLVSACKTAALFLHFLHAPLTRDALTCGAVGAPLEQEWSGGEGEESQLEGGAKLRSLVWKSIVKVNQLRSVNNNKFSFAAPPLTETQPAAELSQV